MPTKTHKCHGKKELEAIKLHNVAGVRGRSEAPGWWLGNLPVDGSVAVVCRDVVQAGKLKISIPDELLKRPRIVLHTPDYYLGGLLESREYPLCQQERTIIRDLNALTKDELIKKQGGGYLARTEVLLLFPCCGA